MKTADYRGFTIRNRQGGRDDWFITLGLRTRWGTRLEIHGDIDHFMAFGYFPAAKQGWA